MNGFSPVLSAPLPVDRSLPLPLPETRSSCHSNHSNAALAIDCSAYESMEVLFGDVRASLPLTAHCARTRPWEGARLIQRSSAGKISRDCQSSRQTFAIGHANSAMVGIILESNPERWDLSAHLASVGVVIAQIVGGPAVFCHFLQRVFIVDCRIILFPRLLLTLLYSLQGLWVKAQLPEKASACYFPTVHVNAVESGRLAASGLSPPSGKRREIFFQCRKISHYYSCSLTQHHLTLLKIR